MNGVIAGRVVDAAGVPVAGASVTLNSNDQPVSDMASLTDAQGRFRRGGLTPGAYELVVHKGDQGHTSVAVNVAAGVASELVVHFGPQAPAGDDLLQVTVVAAAIDWTVFSAVLVRLNWRSVDGLQTTSKLFFLNEGNPDDVTWAVRISDPTQDRYQYRIEYFPLHGQKACDFGVTRDRTLSLDPQRANAAKC